MTHDEYAIALNQARREHINTSTLVYSRIYTAAVAAAAAAAAAAAGGCGALDVLGVLVSYRRAKDGKVRAGIVVPPLYLVQL